MRCCLSHTTALLWLMRTANPRTGAAPTTRATLASFHVPNAMQARELRARLGLGDEERLDVLVARPADRHSVPGVRCHVCSGNLPRGSILPISSVAPDLELFVASPELVFVQMAFGASDLDAIYYGMALCSGYRVEKEAAGGVVLRRDGDAPLTSASRLSAYARRAVDVVGAAHAVKASAFVLDGSGSPKESGLAMLFGLPTRLGGFHLGDVALNKCLAIPDGKDAFGAARTMRRYPDLTIVNRDRAGCKRMVAVDYDGFSVHGSPCAAARDTRRSNEIVTVERLKHFTLTTDDVRDFLYLSRVVDRMRRALGQRSQPLLREAADSAASRRIVEEAERRRFALWAQFVSRTQPF